ncbi:MAG: hypothetical protein JWN76_33 [Chitinophagaceae bacterium]|nr:hypothetical protein [Chitinophagaceae bacterium]
MIVMLMTGFGGFAQRYIESMKIEVSDTRTTNLVFPSNISSIDRGIEKLIVQKSSENILRVKAQEPFAEETNLTVVTLDGKFYSFLVSYHIAPQHLNINLNNANSVNTDSVLVSYAHAVGHVKSTIYGVKYRTGNVSMELSGFYVIDDILFCKIKVENHSNIIYVIERLQIYLSSHRQTKRTASQEREVQPLYIEGDTARVKGKSGHEIIIAWTPFTIPDDQLLTIVLTEKGVGRNLQIKVKKNFITRANLVEMQNRIIKQP